MAPERIEGVFENCSSLIEQNYIYGSGLWTQVVGVVVPHADSLRQWCLSNLPTEEGTVSLFLHNSCFLSRVLFKKEIGFVFEGFFNLRVEKARTI